MWYDKLFNVKYLPLFHHLKAIYQFPKHIIFLVKIVAKSFFFFLLKQRIQYSLAVNVTCYLLFFYSNLK
jgi:hypothetical protein